MESRCIQCASSFTAAYLQLVIHFLEKNEWDGEAVFQLHLLCDVIKNNNLVTFWQK